MPTLTNTPVRRAIYGKLSGDTTLNALLGTPAPSYTKAIYYQVAPQGAEFPYVIFQKQAGTPAYVFANGGAGYDEVVWLIKGVGHAKPGDTTSASDKAEAIAQRLDVLLTDGALSISGATQLYLRRDSDIDYGEVVDGDIYRHSGMLLRLIFQ